MVEKLEMSSANPRKWRFTWEAQSHAPTLKLYLFDSTTKPSIHCKNLDVHLILSKFHLLVSWLEERAEKVSVSLKIPVPRVLVDDESPLSFRALDDHIEAKLVLLLPVDHPIITSFDSALNLNHENSEVLGAVKPLNVDSDFKSLSSTGGVHFYCRICSTRLTRSPIRRFVEIPSANWRELADNWFGACCCSFGGISEKLVNRYAHAYTCAMGVCLLDSTTVTLCKDDLLGCKFSGIQDYEPTQEFTCDDILREESAHGFGTKPRRVASCDSQSGRMHGVIEKLGSSNCSFENIAKTLNREVTKAETKNNFFCVLPASDRSENVASKPGCCGTSCHTQNCNDEVNTLDGSETSSEDRTNAKAAELMENQRSFLNGFLGNGFISRSYYLSKDIEWKQFVCSHCSSLLGAYPCGIGDAPVDDGVRLFKCCMSTSLPVGGSTDLFRNFTLERMFTNQLVESAKDELSFRTVVRDLTTKSPMLQVVLLNPNLWCCSGNCSESDSAIPSSPRLDLQPVIKVLFSDCRSNTESQLRVLEDWVAKVLADEVFMFAYLIEELIETMASAKDLLPPSCTFLQGLFVSSMLR